ncbi:MAG: HD domain-containing protein [Patescibacteria group bacterium]|jgi:GTP pyrophosphokinase
MSLPLLKQIVKSNYPNVDIKPLEQSYYLAAKKLKGQKRGNMIYFDHPVETAMTVAKMKMGIDVVTAALLHDLPRHSDYTLENIENDYGKKVATIIKSDLDLCGVESRFRGTERYVESAKRMFFGVTHDFQSILVKFAEHLNNLDHLDTFPESQQKRMVEIAEKIYIPLASMLGIWRLRWRMEDMCFKYRQPLIYQKIQKKIEKGLYRKRQQIVDQVRKKVLAQAKKYQVKCRIDSRFKHVASIYRKMKEKNKRFNEIYDVFAVRVITDKLENCYLLMGVIHNLWKPVPRRVKDYIASPKPNGYQSLHTTVFSEDGNPIEFQIRTKEMHDEAQYGLAAHWYYKHSYGDTKIPHWIKEVLAKRKIIDDDNKKVFLDELSIDSLTDHIFCYTPSGDIIEMPRGATPVDFAYAVHTDLGHHGKSAVVNDIDRPLDVVLKNNDVVEIIKKMQKHPLKIWLKFVKTTKAKEAIKSYHEKNKDEGKEIK